MSVETICAIICAAAAITVPLFAVAKYFIDREVRLRILENEKKTKRI